MWLGIIIGLLLGGALQSFQAAMVLALIGAVVGALISRRGAGASNDNQSQTEVRRQLRSLQEQLRQATERIARIEKHLHETTSPAEAAPRAPSVVAQAEQERTPEAATLTFDEDELLRQALVSAVEGETSLVTEPVLPNLPVLELPPLPPAAMAEKLSPAPAVKAVETIPPVPAAKAEPVRRVSSESFPYRRGEPPVAAEPTWFSEFVKRWVIGGNPIVKVGVLILFLGFAFLLRYVAENTVVPIELRYAGVAAAGIGLLLFGWRWRAKKDNYGLILQGAGIGVLYLTTLAGMKLHPLIPAELGFAILIGVAAFAALLAILQDALALAVVAALGGFAAPVLASTGSQHHLAFFGYLTVINLGIVAVAWFKAWRVLNLIGFVCTFALAGAWGDKYYQPALFGLVEPFLLLFFALYVLIAFLFARRTLADAEADETASFAEHVRQAAPRVAYVDASLVFGVPMTTFGLQYLISRSFENGPAFSALGFGLLYIVLASVLFRRSGMRYALLSETMIALAVVFGSLAIPLGLEGEWTSAAWAVEAAGVYWVGIRQQRLHARLFALLLLFGSTVYFALDLHSGDGDSVIAGSRLGCLMLALALWWTYRLLRQAPADELHAFEHRLRPWLIAAGSFFIALLPFLQWTMDWAAGGLALLGALAVFAARRLGERSLIGWGCAYQLLGGALFLTTLQRAGDGSVLANGWSGLLLAGLIGLALLVGAWGARRPFGAGQNPAVDGENGANSAFANPVLLAGLAFVNLAPLFVLPWRLAVMVWPLTAIATLWWAVRAGRRSALAFAMVLQVVAGAIAIAGRLVWVDALPVDGNPAPFLHAAFWTPLLIALAALVGARLLQRRDAAAQDVALGWGSLAWSLAWWALAWSDEVYRLLPPATAVATLLGLTVLSAAAGLGLARRFDWPQAGQATAIYLPALALLLLAQTTAGVDHPLAGWGLLAWPLALLMHGRLLRAQEACLPGGLLRLAHTLGAWLFLLLAMREVHWQMAGLGEAGGAWSWLGWALAPLAFLWSLNSERLGRRWPLVSHGECYALFAAPPVAIFLLAWVWLGNALGDAGAPLPYLPLLNPLEIGQIGILLGIALWTAGLREQPAFRQAAPLLLVVLGVSSFAVLSSMVLRTCHQWGGVAWHSEALMASMLAQAALSIVWSLLAIGLMLFAHRRALRPLWLVGAALVAVVVAKLFLVELAASGSLERIVSFIVVGLLLLLVGYFAPLPPRREAVDVSAQQASAV